MKNISDSLKNEVFPFTCKTGREPEAAVELHDLGITQSPPQTDQGFDPDRPAVRQR